MSPRGAYTWPPEYACRAGALDHLIPAALMHEVGQADLWSVAEVHGIEGDDVVDVAVGQLRLEPAAGGLPLTLDLLTERGRTSSRVSSHRQATNW